MYILICSIDTLDKCERFDGGAMWAFNICCVNFYFDY